MNQEKFNEEYYRYRSDADLSYLIARFGDHIAAREEYKDEDLQGIAAVHFYICHKFQWRPAEVQKMSAEELRFLLTEEMQGWTLPKDARVEGL